MKIEDILAMEVPKKHLVKLCSDYDLKSKGNSTQEYVETIVSNKDALNSGEKLAEEFRYAGKTAARLYEPMDLNKEFLSDIDKFKDFLIKKYGDNIFRDGIRVEAEETPKLFRAVLYKGKLYLSYIYLGPETRVFRNFEIVKETPQYIDYLVLHFEPLLLESRVSVSKDSLFKEAFLNSIGIAEDIEWFNMLQMGNKAVECLKNELGGELVGAKHKMTEGIYDTVEVKAKPQIDLSEEDEYTNMYSNKPYRSLTLQFPYKYRSGLEENVSIRITKEGINFYSAVSEEVIQFIIDRILSINEDTYKQIAASIEEAAKK